MFEATINRDYSSSAFASEDLDGFQWAERILIRPRNWPEQDPSNENPYEERGEHDAS